MENLSLLTYTYSKCADLHEAYFGRIKKYFPGLKNNYVTCDTNVSYAECIVYDNNQPHSLQMINALKAIPTDYLIYSQEDYILFDYVKEEEVQNFISLMNENPQITFIRLIESGVGDNIVPYNTELSYVDSSSMYFYSTQISLWRKSDLFKMFGLSKVNSIFDEPLNSPYLKSMGAVGLFTTKKGSKVGGHYNSYYYPYIATAKVKGKWNILEYPAEIENLFSEYKSLKQ